MLGETPAEYSRRGQAVSSALRRERTRQAIVAAVGSRTVASSVHIAYLTGLSKSTIRRHLNALVAARRLVEAPHPHDMRVRVYRINTERSGHGQR